MRVSTPTDTVQVKTATIKPSDGSGDWFKDKLVLAMTTADGVDVKFELDVMAAILLSLTLNPSISIIKERAVAQGELPGE